MRGSVVEHHTDNVKVVGSIPTAPTKFPDIFCYAKKNVEVSGSLCVANSRSQILTGPQLFDN